MHQPFFNIEEIIKQKDAQIESLTKRMKLIENEKNIYKQQMQHVNASSVVYKDMEVCLNELNLKLASIIASSAHQNLFTPNGFDSFFIKLFDILKQNSKSNTQIANVERTRESILRKFSQFNQTMTRLKKYEAKNVELESRVEQIKLELDSLKQAINCNKLYSQGELQVVCNSLMKWKIEMKQLNAKVIEQNKLINSLVKKYENMRTSSSVSSGMNVLRPSSSQAVFKNNDFLTPPSSYETMNEAVTIMSTSSNEVLLQVYQCPKCKLEISNEIDFRVFTDHVEYCSPNKLTCCFCLKFFDQKDYHKFLEHVTNH